MCVCVCEAEQCAVLIRTGEAEPGGLAEADLVSGLIFLLV